MEIQSLVKSGKMQRIKSTAVLQNARSSMVALAARPLDRKVSINTGAVHLCHAALATFHVNSTSTVTSQPQTPGMTLAIHTYTVCVALLSLRTL